MTTVSESKGSTRKRWMLYPDVAGLLRPVWRSWKSRQEKLLTRTAQPSCSPSLQPKSLICRTSTAACLCPRWEISPLRGCFDSFAKIRHPSRPTRLKTCAALRRWRHHYHSQLLLGGEVPVAGEGHIVVIVISMVAVVIVDLVGSVAPLNVGGTANIHSINNNNRTCMNNWSKVAHSGKNFHNGQF